MWPWVDPEAVLWQFRLLPPPLCPWNVYFTCHSHSWSWPKDMALRQWGGVETILMDRIPLRLLYKRLRFWRAGIEIYSFRGTQDKPPTEVPLLIKPSTYQSGMVCLFLWALPALCAPQPPEELLKSQTNDWQARQETKEMGLGKEASVEGILSWPSDLC